MALLSVLELYLYNANFDGKGYFLTAYHCLNDYSVGVSYDFKFRWNYEKTNCTGAGQEQYFETVGGTILVKNPFVDVALLEIDLSALDGTGYVPYFAGWDTNDVALTSGVVMHHPGNDPSGEGQPKRISIVGDMFSTALDCPIDNGVDVPAPGNWWRVSFTAGVNGQSYTSIGSSGSALFGSHKRVMGHLAACPLYTCTPKFGKFGVSYTGTVNNNNINERLNHWLNPNEVELSFLDGYDPNCPLGVYLEMDCNKFLRCNLIARTFNAAPPLTYQWSISNSSVPGGSMQGNVCGDKMYSVTVTDSNGCVASYEGQFEASIACYDGFGNNSLPKKKSVEYIIINDVKIDFLNTSNTDELKVMVYDVMGSLKWEQANVKTTEQVNIKNISAGIYFIIVIDHHNNEVLATKKIFISGT